VKPTWVACQGSDIPDNAVVAGYEDGEPTLYVARGSVGASDLTPGKAGKRLGKCLVSWTDTERSISSYEVLIASPGTYKWVPIPDGAMDILKTPGLILGGHDVDDVYRDGMYVARAQLSGALVPGKASRTFLHLTLKGQVVIPTTGREVLCYA